MTDSGIQDLSDLPTGSVFVERFRIESVAGRGGMGVVFQAIDEWTGQKIALKVLYRGTEHGAERFQREALLLAQLQHEGLVAYIASGQSNDGRQYLAMEWLEGHDLSTRLVNGPLSVDETMRLALRVAGALAVAHDRGIIHRDLKPSNLFLRNGSVDEVTLLDFGLARREGPGSHLTMTGVVVGTIEYMAPEQARARADVGPAADVFSLGCVLYECLTGTPPFVAEHISAALVKILFEDPKPISMLRPELPRPLELLIRRMLAKESGQRPTSARELLNLLTAVQDETKAGSGRTPTAGAANGKSGGRGFADSDQVLLSVILARSPVVTVASELDTAKTISSASLGKEMREREVILREMALLGARAAWLVDGSLVGTVSFAGSAGDQAAVAARCASLLRNRLPTWEVALTTGRGAQNEHRLVGEAVDRAAALLRSPDEPLTIKIAALNMTNVRLDALSARLLERVAANSAGDSTEIAPVPSGAPDPGRNLLGIPTICVGREQELGLLNALLEGCIEEPTARAVLITAPSGIGKSRLRREFLRRISHHQPPVQVLSGRPDLVRGNEPFCVVSRVLRRRAGIHSGDPAEQQRQKLWVRLAHVVEPDERQRVAEFLGELCDVPWPDRAAPLLSAARGDGVLLVEQMTQAFIDFLRGLASRAPVIFIVEDMQWVDEESTRLLDAALRELAAESLPFLLLALGRPEVRDRFPGLWSGLMAQELHLNGLGKRASERMVKHVLGSKITDDETQRLVEQAAGNPLILEELMRNAVEPNIIAGAPPDTVLAMLQARISRLDPMARRVLLAASIFGPTFHRGGVATILELSAENARLVDALQALVNAELVERERQSRFPNEVEYRFRHGLLREAAYALLTEKDLLTGHELAVRFLVDVGETDRAVLREHRRKSGSPASRPEG